ncbi:MAG: hypothetical protein ACYDD1_12710 [Caulobacteraceae bacterium]
MNTKMLGTSGFSCAAFAKLANKLAEADRFGPGVTHFSSEDVRAGAYASIGLDDVWGRDPATGAKLAAQDRRCRGLRGVAARAGGRSADRYWPSHAKLRDVLCHPMGGLRRLSRRG